MASGCITSWETVADFILRGSKITADHDCSHEIKRLTLWKESYDQPRQHIKKQRHYFANKDPSSQSYSFSSSHVWMWELDYKESWAPKNSFFWTVMLEKTLESSLENEEIQSVHPKGNLSWIFIGRTDAEAETPILWPPYAKNWFIWKDPDPGKDWRQEEKGTTDNTKFEKKFKELNGIISLFTNTYVWVGLRHFYTIKKLETALNSVK